MRFLIATILICALGAPVVCAMPVAKSGAQPSSPLVDIKAKVKGGKSSHAASRSRKGDAGGIHPLVGSGDY